MVSSSNIVTQLIEVDKAEKLPFSLQLIVGSGFSVSHIDINRLTKSPVNITSTLYDIIELKDLKIKLITQEPVEVKIIWNKVTEYDVEEEQDAFYLTSEQPMKILFESPDTYAWRCGMYHFEVIYNETTYLGGFRIVPKNVTEDQYGRIHEVINRYLDGLTDDYLNHKKTYGELNDIEQKNYWRFFDWYNKIESLYLGSLSRIEETNKFSLKKTYVVQSTPRHLDQRSIRWEQTLQGAALKGSRFLNRQLIEDWNTSENRVVKHRTMLLLKLMNVLISAFKRTYVDQQQIVSDYKEEILDLKEKIELVKKKKNTTTNSVTKLRHSIRDKEEKAKVARKILTGLKSLEKKYTQFKARLNARMVSPFWKEVNDLPPNKAYIGKNKWHQILHQMWKESQVLFNDDNKDRKVSLPVYKPSYVLYEYYVFFNVIECLNDLGFEEQQQALTTQLYDRFFYDGLSEGTSVALYKDTKKINVVYEEYIQPNDAIALERGTHFFSRDNHSKPDIRIDLYEKNGETWYYMSSVVLEVKYRPLHNIWNPPGKGDTKEMEQMDGYRSIRHIRKENDYNYSAVKSVICVYPGDATKRIMFSASYGEMLQLYPDETSENRTVGKVELRGAIQKGFNL